MERDHRQVMRMVGGVALVVLGALFLLFQALQVNLWAIAWPLLIIIPGLLFFVGMIASGRGAGGLAIPGSIITTTGLLLLYQNAFDQWQSWAYAWALILPTAVGIGLLIQGVWNDHPATIRSGRSLLRVGLVIFAVGLVFFELIIGIGGWGIFGMPLNRYFVPLALIGLGAYLVLRSARRKETRPD